MKIINKLLLLGIIANFLENIVLLLFFGLPLGKQTLIGAGIFALALFLLTKFLQGEK